MAIRYIGHVLMPDIFEKSLDIGEMTNVEIQRIAIDARGCLGTIYDGYTDNIKGRLNVKIKSHSHRLTNKTRCMFIHNCKSNGQNLLEFVGIDHQLRLSIELKMTRAIGIASLIYYPGLINKKTRLLYLYYKSHTELCGDNLDELEKSVRKSDCETYATHIITGIVYGIHLLVILQLNSDNEKDIDAFLSKIDRNLNNNEKPIEMNSNDRALLNQIKSIDVYSNIDYLTNIKTFEEIYVKITELQKYDHKHRPSTPIKYLLTPIQWFYGQYSARIPTLISCEPKEIEMVEYHLLQQSSELKLWNFRIKHDLPELLQGKFEKQLENIQNNILMLRILEDNDIQQISHLIQQVRKGKEPYSIINNKVSLDLPKDIQGLINEIDTDVKSLESKVKLIKRLKSDRVEYCDVEELGIRKGLNEERIRDMLLGNDSHMVIYYSNDTFRTENPERWMIMYSEMLEERKNNPNLRLVYADFTYSTYTLPKMDIIRSTKTIVNNGLSNFKSLRTNTYKRKSLLSSSTTTNECINILLLGESGVGKSTFINAFANYLRFQNLDKAEQGDPIVIIPVLYVMTINDDFDERIIKFGEADLNENHNDFGQSVTQQCKSYVFNISKEKKIRIIDTPGFGDTRGNEQDDLNMEGIFSYLNNFTYLNGICLLFKPEVSQLNSYLRSCCTQIFDYFGENIRDHFIFCFTNARSTFFAPGSTRPLLNAFFESFPVKKIPFARKNTFSFDSESFRYLVAIRNSINFEQNQRSEFEQSWIKSVAESERFSGFLHQQDAYCKNDKWQSVKDAQFQINDRIRPMLEAIRNLLRNTILSKEKSSIQLMATYENPPSMICYSCNRKNIEKVGPFFILPDHLHHSSNACSSDQQKPTEYRLEYEFLSNSVDESTGDLNQQLTYLYETCAKFTYFLMKISQIAQEDSLLNGINRMIDEEQFISSTQTSNNANNLLIDGLEQFKTKYKNYLKNIRSNDGDLSLSNIYDLIKSVNKIHMVEIQLDAIKQYQQHLVEFSQQAVHANETDKK